MNRLDRLTAILTQLQSKRLIKAQEIADRFGISIRTVYRDIRALEEAGVPIIGEAGFGYSLVEGYRLPPIQFTKEEAMAILVAEKIVEKVADKESGKHFNAAMYKIKSVLKSTEKDTLEYLSDQVAVFRNRNSLFSEGKDRLLQSVLSSLTEKHPLFLTYTTFEEEVTTERTVEPVGVYYSFEQWYLIAWCRLRKDYRTFRLDRIHTLKILDETFQNDHPTLNAYLEKVAEKEQLTKVVLRISQKATKYIRQQRYDHGFVMERQHGDWVDLTFMTSSIEGFVRWIIMLADCISILEPVELKDRLKVLLSTMLERLDKAPKE